MRIRCVAYLAEGLLQSAACLLAPLHAHAHSGDCPSLASWQHSPHSLAPAPSCARRLRVCAGAPGGFEHIVDRVYDGLAEAQAAHEYMESNANLGKIVLTVSSEAMRSTGAWTDRDTIS